MTPVATSDILFESTDLRVRRAGGWGGVCFVTFGSYTNEGTLDREGFAEGFLHHEAIDAVHVIRRYARMSRS